MRKDREQANILRKSGMSYSEIMSRMSVPRSTLSDWFRSQKWSNDIAIQNIKRLTNTGGIRLMVMNSIRGNRLKKVYEEAKQEAVFEFEELKYHPLFIAGIMLYRSEGNKLSKHRVSVASSEPDSIKIFVLFLENICRLKTYRIWLLLYSNLDDKSCIDYWIDKCGLKYEQFNKSTTIKYISKNNRSNKGVCNIGLSSAYLKCKILKWIDLMSEEILEERYLNRVESL